MIFPSEIRVLHSITQAAEGRYIENERAQIEKWYKLVRGVKAKQGVKQTDVKQGLGVQTIHFLNVNTKYDMKESFVGR
jgi:hypothetical protein